MVVGFYDNDHVIRELMRFIEITSREYIFEDVTRTEDPPISNVDGFKLKRRFKFFYILNLSVGKDVL